jgi:hypothetical protein
MREPPLFPSELAKKGEGEGEKEKRGKGRGSGWKGENGRGREWKRKKNLIISGDIHRGEPTI